MDKVRYGIIGMGNMGKGHAKYLCNNEDPLGVLTAVCDTDEAAIRFAKENYNVPVFSDYKEMYASGLIDAVIIATPHYSHAEMAIDGFEAGLHVLTEKPAGVYTKQVRLMNEAAAKTDRKFSIMFMWRMNPVYAKIKELLDSGEIGDLKRISWTITTWYRPQAYHDSSAWRGTWDGEGGGVLINQCPHNLDLWQWLFGVPESIYAEASFGKYYNIDVEDEVTAIMHYPNGVTGTFITSTGEAPGTNYLEIVGNNGKLVVPDGGKIIFYKNRMPERTYNKTNTTSFGAPENWRIEIPVRGQNELHKAVTKNFSRAIKENAPIEIPGEEGMKSLQISNAMHLSAWTGKTASLPVDEELYYTLLQERIRTATKKKFK